MGDAVESWLQNLGLQQYSDVFRENDVDLRVLPHLTEDDLKELGVSLGHRRILLAAIDEVVSSDQAGRTEPPAEQPKPARAAERRHLTALFTDLVGYTEMTNRFGAEEMRSLLQSYQDAVAAEVSRFGGKIAKYLGDGLLVYFGWPVAYEDHPYRAIASGLEILTRIGSIKAPDGKPLSARIGVASGLVVVGDLIGRNAREESAVTGSIMNLAARIQAQAPPNSLVIPAEMKSLLGDAFEYQELGDLQLKGFDAPQTVLQVAREKKAESRFRAAHHDTALKTVGRQHELGLLEQTWSRARSGTGEAVILIGEPGIGKSRLVEDFLDKHAEFEGTDIIRLNCSPYFTTTPFHPVAERITQDADLLPVDDAAGVTTKLRALLEGRQTPNLDNVLQVYAALVAPHVEAAQPVVSLPPSEQRDLVTQTMLEVLRHRASARPLLLVVEDAHWIDPSTARLLDRIVATCSDIRLMVLLTHRPDWNGDWTTQHNNVTTLNVRRLNTEQAIELIKQVAGYVPDDEVVQDIVARTDGVPLYVEEVARAVTSDGAQATGEVPSSLQGAMMARLDAVSEEAKQTALTASVFGREFYSDVLASAMGWSEEKVSDILKDLCRSGLIYESGQRRNAYLFRHALLRDTAYQSMVSMTRKERHQKAAEALVTLRPAFIEREPELAARHFTEAGRPKEAFTYWRAATEKALAGSASEEAVANAEETFKVAGQLSSEAPTEQIIARTLLGRSFESIGRLPEALEALDQAVGAARKSGLPDLFCEASYRMADASLMSSQNVGEAYATCCEAIEMLPGDNERMRCRLLSQLARCAMHTGLFAESAEYSREALALATRTGDARSQFTVMMSRFFAPVIAREPEEVSNWRARLTEMQSVADTLGEVDRGRDRSINFFVAMEMGDREMAERALNRLAKVGRARQHPQLHWVEQHGRALIAILDGDFAAAGAYAETALRIGRETHGAHVEGVYGVQMFTLRREQARLGEVAPVIKKLLDDNPGDMSWKPGFGVIAAELGHFDAARRILDEIAETGFDLPMDALYSTTLAYLSDICTAVTADRLAEQLYSLLLPYRDITVTAGVTTVCNGAAGRRLGSLAALLGDWENAQQHFEMALEIDTRMRAVPWVAHTKAAFARALRRRGRQEDAKAAGLLEVEAMEIASKHGMISLTSTLQGQVH
ncbi:guanylate cyclase [Ruegeria sediminis]|uniref:Guanylate cyclase n=1 Tax=Ruegeria sediminis TaxID=2583820 RepID=A0ABY2WXD4_9RHOB|nr:AAA family ATPase [Ruegeria sediminis]TMV07529.1 guanylate cyclase [Ruegeria sediminis]